MIVGSVVSLWRYPVKSMMEGAQCLRRHRAWNSLAIAPTPSWTRRQGRSQVPSTLENGESCSTAMQTYVEAPKPNDAMLPPVWITLPNGTVVRSEQHDIDDILSNLLERNVVLRMPAPSTVSLEEYWPDIEGLTHRETVTDEAMPPETFFDLASIHVLTTSTIDRLRQLYPKGRFEVRRFRPNIVVEPNSEEIDFVDNSWIGHTLSMGTDVRLTVTGPCPRCVMITMPQGDLPADPGILRTAAQHNQANIGVYASVLSVGTLHRGDPVSLD